LIVTRIGSAYPSSGAAVSSAVRTAVRSSIGAKIRSAVCAAIDTAIGATIRSAVCAAIRSAIGAAVPDTGYALGTAVSRSLHAGAALAGFLH
jgi:Arc/MetJ family transcription regulator